MTIPDPTQPHTYPRRILLAVAANSPQIVTETVYALTQHTRPACMPTEVHIITTRQGEPFVRLREGLPQALLAGSSSFSATIAAAQRRFDPAYVRLDWQRATLTCNHIPVPMSPIQLAFYAWMLQRRANDLPPIHWTSVETPDLATQFLAVYARLHGQTGNYEQVAAALREGITNLFAIRFLLCWQFG